MELNARVTPKAKVAVLISERLKRCADMGKGNVCRDEWSSDVACAVGSLRAGGAAGA